MEPTIYDVTLELQQPCVPWALTVKKGDTHRRLRLRLLSGGSPYPVAGDCYAVFTAQKPDGTVLYNACSREGDRILYDLTPQTTSAAGVLDCEIKLYGPDDGLLTTAAFTITVEDTVYTHGEDALTSSGEATALTQLITQARDTIAEVEEEIEKVRQNEANHAVIDNTAVGMDAWSSKTIVDKLCPAFQESGSVITCLPMEGYPLEAISAINAKANGSGRNTISLYHGGKNLIPRIEPKTVTKGGVTMAFHADGSVTISGEPTSNTDVNMVNFPATHLTGKQITISNDVGKSTYTVVHLFHNDGTVTYTWLISSQANKLTGIVPDNVSSLTVGIVVLSGFDGTATTLYPQLEFGTVPTEFESPKAAAALTTDLSTHPNGICEGSYNWKTGVLVDEAGTFWQHDPEAGTFEMIEDTDAYQPPVVRSFPAFSGMNVFSSDCGDTTVTGRKDLIAMLEAL